MFAKGSIGASGKTVSVDRSGMPPSERSRALKAWIGKKVLFMPHPRRDLGDGCPGFTNVPNGGHVSDVCDGKIGTIVSVGPEEYPNVVVDVEGKHFQRSAEAGADESPRIEGLLPIEEIDSLRKRLINKPLLAVGGPLYTYDPDTQSYGSVVIAERQQVTVVDVVSSWAANTTSPFRVIVQTAGGAEGFYDLDKDNLGAFFKTSEVAKGWRVSSGSGGITAQKRLTDVRGMSDAPIMQLQCTASGGIEGILLVDGRTPVFAAQHRFSANERWSAEKWTPKDILGNLAFTLPERFVKSLAAPQAVFFSFMGVSENPTAALDLTGSSRVLRQFRSFRQCRW